MAQTTEASGSSWQHKKDEEKKEEKKPEKLDRKKKGKKPSFIAAENNEAAGSSWKNKEEKKPERLDRKAEKPSFRFPYNVPVSRSSATTIERLSATLPLITYGITSTPIAVAIGPYHHGSPKLLKVEQAKRAALEEFRRSAGQRCEVIRTKVLSLVGPARSCYAAGDQGVESMSDADFGNMMFRDGWFLLQFMVSMCPDNPDNPSDDDLLMKRAEVNTRVDDIARDVLLLENQVPWFVLEPLMELWPARAAVPVDRFLRLMSSAFHVGNEDVTDDSPTAARPLFERTRNLEGDQLPAPPHLLGLFYRRQAGAARTESLRVPKLSSMSSTAVDLAEMGVKITAASKTKEFGYMSMSKRRPGLSLSGELSLAPMVLNQLTGCWLVNMAAYEACLGATWADNFAVSSYVAVVAMLMNRKEDVHELRAKGVIYSEYSDKETLGFFKWLAPSLQVGHRYYNVFQSLQEYKQERWFWIPVHRFWYKYKKTILTLITVAGVLGGFFKIIMDLSKHQR